MARKFTKAQRDNIKKWLKDIELVTDENGTVRYSGEILKDDDGNEFVRLYKIKNGEITRSLDTKSFDEAKKNIADIERDIDPETNLDISNQIRRRLGNAATGFAYSQSIMPWGPLVHRAAKRYNDELARYQIDE